MVPSVPMAVETGFLETGEPRMTVGTPFKDHWTLLVTYVAVEGRLVATDLEIRSNEVPPRSLTSTDLRHVQLFQLKEHQETALKLVREMGVQPFLPVSDRRRARISMSAQQGKPLGDAYFAELAEDYLRVAALDPKTPQRTLLTEYLESGAKDLTRGRLRDRLALAKKRGWIAPHPKRAEGEARPMIEGQRLIEWRKEQEEGKP